MAKNGIHPAYQNASIKCACGVEVETFSTRGDYKVEICSACHPFYTGKQTIVDTAGQVERFQKRLERSAKL